MDISVVVPSIKPPSEIVVTEYLDRCSHEDYEVITRDDYPVTRARNEGYKQANAEKIVFLDDDSMPRDGYLTEASKTLETEDAVTGKTVHPRDDLFSGQLTSHYTFGNGPRNVNRFWGCNMGMRKEALDAVGGWDENMGWGHEEKDLAERVLKRYNIYYNPDMVVDHVYADSLFDFWMKHYRLEKETPYYLRKNGASRQQILFKIISDLFSPTDYLGRSISLTFARSGRKIAQAGGRLVGLNDPRLSTIEDGSRSTMRRN